MKKLILLLGLTMLFTTGCMKYSYNINIKDNGNMTISEVQAVDKTVLNSFGNIAKNEFKKSVELDKQAFEKNGYTVTDYDDGQYTGINKTKKYNVSLFTTKDLPDGFSQVLDMQPITCKRGFFKNKCALNFEYNLPNLDTIESTYEDNTKSTSDIVKSAGLSMIKDSKLAPVADLTIKIPHKATKYNTTKVMENNIYVWNLTENPATIINLEYERINWIKILLVLFAGLCILVLVIKFNKFKDTGW